MQNSKLPRWLKATGRDFSQRGPLPIDEVEGDGTALDTAHGKPSLRWRTYKKVKRRLEEMEEMHDWIEKKGKKELETGETKVDSLLDTLETTLNKMI